MAVINMDYVFYIKDIINILNQNGKANKGKIIEAIDNSIEKIFDSRGKSSNNIENEIELSEDEASQVICGIKEKYKEYLDANKELLVGAYRNCERINEILKLNPINKGSLLPYIDNTIKIRDCLSEKSETRKGIEVEIDNIKFTQKKLNAIVENQLKPIIEKIKNGEELRGININFENPNSYSKTDQENKILEDAFKNGTFVKRDNKLVAYSIKGEEVVNTQSIRSYLEELIKKVNKKLEEINDIKVKSGETGNLTIILNYLKQIFGPDIEFVNLVERLESFKETFRKLRQSDETRENFETTVKEFVDSVNREFSIQNFRETLYKKGDGNCFDNRVKEMERQKVALFTYLYSQGLISKEILKDEVLIKGIELGIVEDHEIMNYWKNMPNLEQDKLTEAEVIEIINMKNNDKEVLKEDFVFGLFKKCKGNLANFYFEILPKDYVVRLFFDNEIRENQLKKINVAGEDILSFDDELIFQILCSKKFPKELKPTHEQIINSNLSEAILIKLAEVNAIDKTDILTIFSRDKSGAVLEDKNILNITQVLNFYNAGVMVELLQNEKLNAKFVENFKKEIVSKREEENNAEQINTYFSELVSGIEEVARKNAQNEDEIKDTNTEYLIKLYLKGIVPYDYISIENINLNSLENIYAENRITDEDIYKLVSDGILTEEQRKLFIGDGEYFNLALEGKVQCTPGFMATLYSEQLKILKNENRIEKQQIVRAYFVENGISIETLKEIWDINDNLSEFIEKGDSTQKIEQLAINYLISSDDLNILVEYGVITKEDVANIENGKRIEEEFKGLFENSVIPISESIPNSRKDANKNYANNKRRKNTERTENKEDKSKFLMGIGENVQMTRLEGTRNSLNGYTIYGYKDLDLIIFAKTNEAGNATYLMNTLQAKFIIEQLKQMEKNDTTGINITKQLIRKNTDHVQVRNKSKNWKRNIIDSIVKLSPEFAKRHGINGKTNGE